MGSFYATLRNAHDKATALIAPLDTVTTKFTNNEEVTSVDKFSINYGLDELTKVYLSELNMIPSFPVIEKEGFDGEALVNEGHKLFPPSTLS